MREIPIPEEVTATVEDNSIVISSGEQSLERSFDATRLDVSVSDDTVSIVPLNERKRTKALAGTMASHVQNMVAGVQEPFQYTLQVVNAHFPMSVEVQGSALVIQNFLGEQHSRYVYIPDGVDVQVSGDEIAVSGSDKELVGMTAGRIEGACYKGSKDLRKFQDGIYLVNTNEQ